MTNIIMVNIHCNLFNQSLIDLHLDILQFFSIMNNVAINIFMCTKVKLFYQQYGFSKDCNTYCQTAL